MPSKRTRWILASTGAVVVVGIGALVAWNRRPKPTPVQLATVGREDLQSKVTANGKVQAQRKVEISATIPGQITQLAVDEGDVPPGTARFYTDVSACAADARAGAGDRDVMVHGAGAGQALIRAGELDEIEVHVAPVLLGSGRRLFDLLDDLREPVELEVIRVLEGRDATHLRYRVVRPG